MEAERGMNVEFINPQPGYVMKTTVDGTTKAFINICQNDKIDKPKAKREAGPDGKSGMMWQIPHSFAPPKDDHDKSRNKCQVFDVVFHPDTFRMASTNARFKKLVEDTATEGIERQFNVKLDKKNIKYPKLKFKGTPTATVIRTKKEGSGSQQDSGDQSDIMKQFPYPYDDKTSVEKAKENEEKSKKKNSQAKTNKKDEKDKATEPKYSITHQSEMDMSEYRNAPDAKTSTRPKKLVVKIDLPLLTSAGQLSLDIFEKRLLLESVTPAAYKLDLALPFPVNDDEGSAKFDKAKRCLTVTLPVIPVKSPSLPFNSSNMSDDNDNNVSDEMQVNGSPLIEVLPDNCLDSAIVNQEINSNSISENSNVSENKGLKNGLGQSKFPDNVKWCLPDYQFSQDNETISFVIKVQSVEENWIETYFPTETAAVIRFMSMGSGGFPSYYRLYLEFPSNNKISSEHSSVDTSVDNIVFVILKEKSCRGLWDSFNAGCDGLNLEVSFTFFFFHI